MGRRTWKYWPASGPVFGGEGGLENLKISLQGGGGSKNPKKALTLLLNGPLTHLKNCHRLLHWQLHDHLVKEGKNLLTSHEKIVIYVPYMPHGKFSLYAPYRSIMCPIYVPFLFFEQWTPNELSLVMGH